MSAAGIAAHEIDIFVQSDAELPWACAAADAAQRTFRVLDEREETVGAASICSMYLAEGLEFRCVAVMACDDERIPLQTRIESVPDLADLEEVYSTERHLLYAAYTRARERLLVTSIQPGVSGGYFKRREAILKVLMTNLERRLPWTYGVGPVVCECIVRSTMD